MRPAGAPSEMPEQGMVGVRCPVSNPRPLAQGRILPCEISYD